MSSAACRDKPISSNAFRIAARVMYGTVCVCTRWSLVHSQPPYRCPAKAPFPRVCPHVAVLRTYRVGDTRNFRLPTWRTSEYRPDLTQPVRTLPNRGLRAQAVISAPEHSPAGRLRRSESLQLWADNRGMAWARSCRFSRPSWGLGRCHRARIDTGCANIRSARTRPAFVARTQPLACLVRLSLTSRLCHLNIEAKPGRVQAEPEVDCVLST